MGRFMSQQSLSSFIWSVADLPRGDYKQSDYGKVILPFTVLRRLDCVLEATKDADPKASCRSATRGRGWEVSYPALGWVRENQLYRLDSPLPRRPP